MSTRLFHFQDGKSNKFWQITLEGASHTVHFGRIGTTGQVQSKEFAGEVEARKSAEKLIAEKLKKGYVEQTGGGTAPPPAPAAGKAAAPPATVAAPAEEPLPAPAAVATVPPRVEAAAPEPATSDTSAPEPPRTLGLSPADWRWATWREHSPLPRPEPPPFDLAEATKRVAKIPASGWDWNWEAARISPFLSREEAEFWVEAMTNASFHLPPRQLAAKLQKTGITGDLTLDEALSRLATGARLQCHPHPWLALPLVNLGTPLTLVQEMIRRERAERRSLQVDGMLPYCAVCEGLRAFVFPYLTEPELAELREVVRQEFRPGEWPRGAYDVLPPPAILLAAFLGLHDLLPSVVDSWPDQLYTGEEWHDYYQRPQLVLFGLGDPRLLEHHFRRLKLRLRNPEHIAAWLAHTEYSALDVVRDSIAAETNKETAEKLLGAFSRVRAPEAAPCMLDLMLSSKAPRLARQWLDENITHSVPGLLPVAAGRGRAAEAAVEYLRALRRKGGEAFINAFLERIDSDIARRAREAIFQPTEDDLPVLDDASAPGWLREAPAPRDSKKLPVPSWVSPQDLPALRVGEHRLADAHVAALLTALAQSTLTEPHPLVTALKANADRTSLDRFGWRLFELWLGEGAPPREKWAMFAVGLFGSDVSALKLTPLIRRWPGESQHQRAVLGLECLRAIGTDTALMQINGIAQKVPFKAIKARAGECIEAIAADLGLTRAQLEDRIVPDCDLDERGSRVFDFGPRQFRFVLGEGMKPMVKEADGKLRTDLPKPNSRDDATKAAAAVDEWKLLKKTVAQVAKVQAVRLEQAMVTGRRWSRSEFEELLVRHPLMTNLVRLLVWGGYNAEGRLAGTFRVTEDLTYASGTDEEVTLDEFAQVGIVHPYHLDAEERSVWGELFADYELVPPFSQLGRPILTLEPSEEDQTELKRFACFKVAPQSLVSTLEKLDWQRGMAEDGGVYYLHSKPFYGANVTAVVEYEGVPMGYLDDWDDQSIDRCFFVSGIWKPDSDFEARNRLPLGKVDPVVISEVLSDLSTVVAKAK